MELQRKALVIRSLASAATAAGLVFASWSTPANAASKSTYHGLDVASLKSDISVVQGPVAPMRVNGDIFAPRDSKGAGSNKTKNTKGTGSKSKGKGSATGTNSASKKASKDGSITKGTGSKNSASKHAAVAGTADSVTKGTGSKNTASKMKSNTGTNSASKHVVAGTADSVTKGTGSKNSASKHVVAASNTGTMSASKVKSNTGTNSASKHVVAASNTGTMSASKVKSNTGTNSASKHVAAAASNTGTRSASKVKSNTGTNSNSKVGVTTTVFTPSAPAPTNVQTVQTMPAIVTPAPTVTSVLGTQTPGNEVQGLGTPMTGNGQSLTTVAGQETNGVVMGVQSLPSTSTADAANLAGAGLALIASGGGILVIKRRRK